MKNVGMSLQFYQKHKSKYNPEEKIKDAITRALSEFEKKYGYRPDGVILREDEVNGNFHLITEAHKDIEFRLVRTGCTPSHFMLYPAITKRIPRILTVKRNPVL